MTKHHDALPTATYAALQAAYDHFNKDLFDGRLPPCLITLRAAANSYGYYHTGRFVAAHGKGSKPVAEIAMNPKHFAERSVEKTLSTLGHEMAHCEQAYFGREPTRCYHDKQWAGYMKRIGLMPSDTAAPGGKETGPRVSHYILKDGPFAKSCAAFLKRNSMNLYQDRLAAERALGKKGKGKGGEEGEGEGGEAKSTGRAKFCCKGCGLNAWAKPSAKLRCDDCKRPMRVEEKDESDDDD